jgi:glycosyltransferase EpsF
MDFCCKGDSAGPYASRARDLGADVFHLQLRITQIGFIHRLRQLVASGNYQIVHTHLETYSGLSAFVCRTLGIPHITSFHNTAFPPITWLRRPGLRQLRHAYGKISVRYALRNSAILTGCSQDVVNSVRKSYGSGNSADWRVLYYGTDLPPHATPQERLRFRESFGWPADTPIIVHVGRFVEQKNHFGLLRIFELTRRQIPDAKLLLIGGGRLRPAVEAMAQELGLSECVRFLGYQEDPAAILRQCDLLLFPSWFEGLPMTALEASAAAIPIVASDVPGISETVQDGVTGLLRDPHDIQGMADAVLGLRRDPDLAHRLGAAGRQCIAERFTKRISAVSLLRIYRECLDQR